MSGSIDDKQKELLEAYGKLSDEEQRAVAFIVCHYDDVAQICRQKKLTAEKRSELIENGLAENDSLLLAFVLLERRLNGD